MHDAMSSLNRLELSGIEHMRLGELAAAEMDLSEVLTRRAAAVPADSADQQSLSTAINNLAVLHLKQRRLQEAAAGFERVIAIATERKIRAPSSRNALELDAATRNLAAAQQLSQVTRVLQPTAAEPPSRWNQLVPRVMGAHKEREDAQALKGDLLRAANVQRKERIAKALGVNLTGSMSEPNLDDAIRRSLSLRTAIPHEVVDSDGVRVSINMAFDMLDMDGDGAVSRAELLKGLASNLQVRQVLQLGPLADPSEFDALYAAIDADASNTIERAEFESFFLRRLLPQMNPRALPSAPYAAGDPSTAVPRSNGPPAGHGSLRGPDLQRATRVAAGFLESGATTAAEPSMPAVVPRNDGSEISHLQMRRLGLQQDLTILQAELGAVEAHIERQTATDARLRSLTSGQGADRAVSEEQHVGNNGAGLQVRW